MSLESRNPRAAGEEQFTVDLEFELNGTLEKRAVPTSTTVLDLLRNSFGKRGVRSSCERSVCGACTVLVDDLPVAACSTFAFDIDGTRVETVEGLAAQDGTLSAQQRAFRECGGFQCGFCTSGMLMLTTGLLRVNPQPGREEIREWISSNTCRCTGYEMILESVERAAELTRDEQPGEESR
ncbi:(2Fe-2S)-binding protein [Paenarthrobacter sp. NPDC092416]|uniref:(2Fe-2S)-binding protein n=1 Tax=Paenarthrobacter sp. NPDC092416 TaxID=3364386 RepID=UPI003807E9C0